MQRTPRENRGEFSEASVGVEACLVGKGPSPTDLPLLLPQATLPQLLDTHHLTAYYLGW